MHTSTKFNGKPVQIAALKYTSSNLAMMIVLPKDTETLEAIIKDLHEYQPMVLRAPLLSKKVDLQLPKFKIKSSQKLKPALKKMGLENAFSKGGDFGGMINTMEPVKIGSFEHVVAIEVNENGTEAAAATSKSPPVKFQEKFGS